MPRPSGGPPARLGGLRVSRGLPVPSHGIRPQVMGQLASSVIPRCQHFPNLFDYHHRRRHVTVSPVCTPRTERA